MDEADEIRIPCGVKKGKAQKRCEGYKLYAPPTGERPKRWQFQCAVCRHYNLADDLGIVIATSPKPFDLDNLLPMLRP